MLLSIAPFDQVPRKLAYLATHPGTKIVAPCSTETMWRASLRDDTLKVDALDLEDLLDQLEDLEQKILAPGPGDARTDGLPLLSVYPRGKATCTVPGSPLRAGQAPQ
jgi:hypothetical protein